MGRSSFLEFGDSEQPGRLALEATLSYLEQLGHGVGGLHQARAAIASKQSETFVFDALGSNYCDFCFAQIMGGEYDVLKDGRDRCSRCSRTVLSTHDQFVDEFQQVRFNMELVFGISLSRPMTVRMVNAREIARRTGETFTPTAGVDPRVLGFASMTKDGHELFVENGAPRMAAIATMAHELTHVWQHGTWSETVIAVRYGKQNVLAVYEGMAMWAMVQYLLYIRDFDYANRQHAYAIQRDDAYGDGYRVFLQRYPLDMDGEVGDDSPFMNAFPL